MILHPSLASADPLHYGATLSALADAEPLARRNQTMWTVLSTTP